MKPVSNPERFTPLAIAYETNYERHRGPTLFADSLSHVR
jgi:hypothetical protein